MFGLNDNMEVKKDKKALITKENTIIKKLRIILLREQVILLSVLINMAFIYAKENIYHEL